MFALISSLFTATSATPGRALPYPACILHSRSFHNSGVIDFLNENVHIESKPFLYRLTFYDVADKVVTHFREG